MAIEIERKFLINSLPEGILRDMPSHHIEQGYIAIHEDFTEVRIRKFGDGFWQTIKTAGDVSRQEFELPLSEETYEKLRPLTTGRRLTKTRFQIPIEPLVIEIDCYEDELQGLIVAEVEFESLEQCEAFTPPPWFGPEITGQKAYKNYTLSTQGLPPKL